MIKVKVTPGTYNANDTIPLTSVFNTNNSLNLTNNSIVIRKPGFLELNGSITFIGTAAGDVAINLIDNNNNVLTSFTMSFTAIGDYETIPIYDLLRIIYNTTGIYGSISLQTNANVTVNNGIVTAKYIQ